MNTDSKLEQHVVNRSLTGHVARHTHPAQRGFVAGRQSISNAVELDGEMRRFAMEGDVHRLAVAVFFDLIAALPSIDNEFLLSAVRVAGLPAGVVWFVRSMYASATLVIALCEGIVRFSDLTAWVSQGSPSVRNVVCVVHGYRCGGRGLRCSARRRVGARACADDVGAVVSGIARLPPLADIFIAIEAAAGLALHVTERGRIVPS